MPPAALTSSAAIMMPLCVDWPNVACGPVIEPYSPTRMSPPPPAPVVVPPPSFGGQPRSPNDNTASEIKMIAFFRIALLFKELRIVHEATPATGDRFRTSRERPPESGEDRRQSGGRSADS